MLAELAVRLLDALDAEDAGVVVGGGWAVDALLERQTREHADLDLWVPAERLERLVLALVPLGIDRIQYWGDNRPWNFPLHDGRGTRVDLHLVERLADGGLHYGGVESGIRLPDGALDGTGSIGGRPAGAVRRFGLGASVPHGLPASRRRPPRSPRALRALRLPAARRGSLTRLGGPVRRRDGAPTPAARAPRRPPR